MRWLLVLCLLVLAGPVRAEWVVGESDHFRVYARESEKYVREKVALLEDFRGLLVNLTGADMKGRAAEPKLDVYLVRNFGEVRPFSRVSGGFAGSYAATPGGIMVYVTDGAIPQQIMLHEYALHFMLSSGGTVYPPWYLSGFAEFMMTATFAPETVTFGNVSDLRGQWLARHTWMPLHQLLDPQLDMTRRDNANMFYPQSWLLAHYMLRVEPEKLKLYLQAVAKGEHPAEAFTRHVNEDLLGFQLKLQKYLFRREMRYSIFKRAKAVPAQVKISNLSPAADDLLLLLLALRMPLGDDQTKARAKEMVEKAAARHVDDPLATRTLALLALRLGDRERAAALFDQLLKVAPEDSDLLYWRALSVAPDDEASRAEARRYLVRAFKANPEDWRTLRAYAVLQGSRNKPLAENDFNVLSLAWEIAPQVTSVAFDMTTAAVHSGDMALAAKVLAPVANGPRDLPSRTLARELFQLVLAGDKAGYLARMQGDMVEAVDVNEDAAEDAAEEQVPSGR